MQVSVLCSLMLLLAGCQHSWKPTPLADGYQIMVMNSQEIYIANADNELLLGPRIETIGAAPGVIVVNCGSEEVVVNGFANTVGLNLIDTSTGRVAKQLTPSQVEEELRSRNTPMPEMRPLSTYLH
jgi:hypothetical protein